MTNKKTQKKEKGITCAELQAIDEANCKVCNGSGWTVEGWAAALPAIQTGRDPFEGDCAACGGTGKVK